MKITTLIAAAAFATVSTAALAQNVTTESGEIVMIEKNQQEVVPLLPFGVLGAIILLGGSSTTTATTGTGT